MTQVSRPTAQHVDNYPYGDSGPYSSLQWRTLFKTMFTNDDNQGPVAGYEDELEVTNPIGKTIRVASGAAVVGGNIFFNSADVEFSPPNPAGAARYDYVVACLNDTDTSFTVSDAGHTLAFPTDLTDYNSASSIQEYACRLAIVRGAEGGGLPTLDQNDDHYMIPLASYLISTAGALSSFTDQREFTGQDLPRYQWVSASAGYNTTDGTQIPPTTASVGGWEAVAGVNLPDNKVSTGVGHAIVDKEIGETVTMYAVLYPNGAGNLYGANEITVAECSGASQKLNIRTNAQHAVTSGEKNCIDAYQFNVSDLDRGDILTLLFSRNAVSGSDTVNADAILLGWYLLSE